ncbi:MAG: dipicolinate synthase subunit B [Firmicutes bacterium]|nr:dipicolinate synthase subunit B [Bacillota bacterium]
MTVILNNESSDKRVAELGKLFDEKDLNIPGLTIAFWEPRFVPSGDELLRLPKGTKVFGYPKTLNGLTELGLEYHSLLDDAEFVKENNRLTALAMKEILGDVGGKKVLIIGWGALFAELEKVLGDVHLLTLNPDKVNEARQVFGDRAHGEEVRLNRFDIVINTVPKQIIKRKHFGCLNCKKPKIYELASAPYGFEWAGVPKEKYDYKIEQGLPGRFFPQLAALAAYNSIMKKIEVQDKPSVVLGITGSSCTYTKLLPVVEELSKTYDIIPVMSEAADQENRFCDIVQFRERLREITGKDYMKTISDTEYLSHYPNIVAGTVVPATGNTIARLANAVHDGAVTLAMKALLRNNKPIIIGISTNDALCGGAENIGKLMGRKNIYFVPFTQDDPHIKPYSIVCHFDRVKQAIDEAIQGKQIQPILT